MPLNTCFTRTGWYTLLLYGTKLTSEAVYQ